MPDAMPFDACSMPGLLVAENRTCPRTMSRKRVTLQVGGEKRLITGFTSTLLLRTEKEEGGIALLEITDEYLAKVKSLRDRVHSRPDSAA